MSESAREHLSVAKAFYQLEFYLRMVHAPFTVKDLYERAYRKRRKDQYDDRWLSCLDENPEVQSALDEPFTAHTIIETLMRTGHRPVVRALLKEIRRHHIIYTEAYMVGMPDAP
ncbi:hypothetical protein GCM10010885_12210 [Alicyclobacillus cellulosilyticus]|uniref:Uncharacterized protein n=1 Tax=Alicyclobacillus cellulosilyticus TaxID=1003997 RepID=A0A917K843_9BACL|nr:hypothetical protein [Alicyclobacillus cellulosilyticus]GGJ04569.1 hypothetical protein GCM10010885_12210 [Alicyclobacillus cellulosilyticus]